LCRSSKRKVAQVFGTKEVLESHDVAVYGDPSAKDYLYGKKTATNQPMPAKSWTPLLKQIKERVEGELKLLKSFQLTTPLHFNLALVNRFLDGSDSMGWHQDKELKGDRRNAIVTLFKNKGDRRRFQVRSTDDDNPKLYNFFVSHGDIFLFVGAEMQSDYRHCVPKEFTREVGERISISFRLWQ
jgi:alkylated DNA repair dioxygenase AlkB